MTVPLALPATHWHWPTGARIVYFPYTSDTVLVSITDRLVMLTLSFDWGLCVPLLALVLSVYGTGHTPQVHWKNISSFPMYFVVHDLCHTLKEHLFILYVLVVYGLCHTLKEHLFIPYVLVVHDLCHTPKEHLFIPYVLVVYGLCHTLTVHLFIPYLLVYLECSWKTAHKRLLNFSVML